MADEDIDIEEHDVLDNPVIRSIFPDISVIKKEISQYYEDVPDIKPDPESITNQQEVVSTNAAKDVKTDHRNPPIKPLVDIVDISYFNKIQRKKERQQSNKIILGSKPSNKVLSEKKNNPAENKNERKNGNETESTIRVPKVFLQDLGAYIYRSNRYCKECFTLFSSKIDFDNHKRKVHSMIKKKIELNVAEHVSEKSKSELHKNKCKICNTNFSTSASLARHCKNVHRKLCVKPKDISLKHTSKSSGITYKKRNLIINNKRVNMNIQLNKSPLKQNTNKCSICASILSSISNLKRHYKNVHRKNVTFNSNHSLKKTVTHNKKKISHIVTTRSRKLTSNTSNLCFHCKESFPDNKSLINHIYEVLEPKHLSKYQLRKKITQMSGISRVRLIKKTGQIKNTFSGKSLRDKLIYENQDSDDNRSDQLDSEEINVDEDLVSNTSQKKKANVTEAKKQKKVVNDIQDTTDSGSNHYDSEENNENENFETNIPQTIEGNTFVSDRRLQENMKVVRSKKDENNSRKCITKKAYSNEQLKRDRSKITFCKTDNQSSKKNENKPKASIKNNKDQNRSRSLKRKQNHSSRHSSTDKRKQDSQTVKLIKNKDPPSPNIKKNQRTDVKKNQDLDQFDSSQSNSSDNSSSDEFDDNKTNHDKIKGDMVYECVYCSYMLVTARAYYNHVTSKHRVVKISQVHKIKFYNRCKYCPSKSNHMNSHNLHLYRYHYNLVYKQFPNEIAKKKDTSLKNPMFRKFENFVLESIIYKCSKCDVHFSSSCIAKDHEKHMELLINWKCSVCGRIFKKHDKYLHLKQHKVSKTLNVCQFTESELDRLLYNCTKCAIHFTEDRYLEHFSNCDEQVTDSVYCKKCDILIDKCGYQSHESYHKLGENVTDFTFVAADIIDVVNNKEVVVEKKRKRLYEQINCYTFCPTCKCFLTDVGLSRKTHIEARCSQIPKHICNLCGFFLTGVSLKVHRNRHRQDKDLNLNNFKFFDLKGTQINPPVPEYPRCTNCDVYFVSKNAVKYHMCVETDSLNCDICNIKLSENAFKLHMQFHDYRMRSTKKETKQATSVIEQTKSHVMLSDIHEQQINTDVPNGDKTTNLNSNTESTEHSSIDLISTDNSNGDIIMYSCQSCKLSVDSYDKVVEHCQSHFSSTGKSFITKSTICPDCSMHIEIDAYEKHQQFHSSCDTIQYFTFDPVYFTCDNDTWIEHVFSDVLPTKRKEILRESIYQHECRIKMEIVQKGPFELTVYKCDNCGNFIDPDCLFAHVKDCCRKNIRIHPCVFCGLPFMSNNFRSKHEKIHRRFESIRIKSYNMVLINCEAHRTYTNSIIRAVNNYVLYQCRTCNGVVEKFQRDIHQCNVDNLRKCSMCKLLINRADYNSHVSKHKHFDKFIISNMKLILFGNNDELNLKKIVSPAFCGKICDYTLYKCAKCEICVNDNVLVSNHICTSDNSKWRCHLCDFYIGPDSLKQHMDMHEADLDFKTENIRIISFDSSTRDDDISGQTIEETSHSSENNNLRENGMDADDAIIPAPAESQETKTIDNNASGDDINIHIEENAPVRIEENAAVNVEENAAVHVEENATVHVEENAPVRLYKCTCGLHYKDEVNAKTCCTAKVKVVRQTCTKCSLVFNPKELFSHLIAHHGDKNKKNNYDIIKISPENESDVKET